MADDQACVATCSANVQAQGIIRCKSRLLFGASYCIDPSDGLSVEQVTEIVGKIEIESSVNPNIDSLTVAISDALELDVQFVLVSFSAQTGKRLLSSLQRAAPR